jgi:hypothetical protein
MALSLKASAQTTPDRAETWPNGKIRPGLSEVRMRVRSNWYEPLPTELGRR